MRHPLNVAFALLFAHAAAPAQGVASGTGADRAGEAVRARIP